MHCIRRAGGSAGPEGPARAPARRSGPAGALALAGVSPPAMHCGWPHCSGSPLRSHLPFSSCVYKHTSFGSCASHFIRTASCYQEAFKGANDREYHRSALLWWLLKMQGGDVGRWSDLQMMPWTTLNQWSVKVVTPLLLILYTNAAVFAKGSEATKGGSHLREALELCQGRYARKVRLPRKYQACEFHLGNETKSHNGFHYSLSKSQ